MSKCKWEMGSACYKEANHEGPHQTWHLDKIERLESDLAAAEAKLEAIRAQCIGMAGSIHGNMVYAAIVEEILDAAEGS